MYSLTQTQCAALLQGAVAAAFGLVVKTNNPTRARQAIYRFRKDFALPEYKDIQVRVSPDDPEGEIWLLRNSVVASPTMTLGLDYA